MKKVLFYLLSFLPLTALAWQGDVIVETPNTQLLLTAQEGGDLRQSYYGDKSATLQQLRDAGCDLSFHALPAFGTVDVVQLPALQVQHFDGDLNLELHVTDYAVQDEARSKTHIFTMQDKLMPVTVKVFYKAFHAYNSRDAICIYFYGFIVPTGYRYHPRHLWHHGYTLR